MRTKPLIIVGSVATLLIAAVLFILYGRGRQDQSADGVNVFLEKFTTYAVNGQADSLLNCFAPENQNIDGVKRLVNVLTGKNSVSGDAAPLAKLKFFLEESVVETLSDGTVSATIPLFLTNSDEKLGQKRSLFTLKLTKLADGDYKINQADVRQFFTDFVAYENFVRRKTLKDEDIYDPRTLAAFKVADKLKTLVDSVVWFSHIDDKTYFYVVNGEWQVYSMDYDIDPEYKTSYKMGLIGPDLQPIIPTEFDIIRHIGGTFPDLIEVERDHKKGFYDIAGKEVLPAQYDQIFPLEGEGDNIAALRIGDDYFWFKSDYTISDKADIKLEKILPNLRKVGAFNTDNIDLEGITEFNSREDHAAIYLPPSYMVDLDLVPVFKSLKNPLRRRVGTDFGSEDYIVSKDAIVNSSSDSQQESWWETLYYSIRNHFVDGRTEFYHGKKLVIIDKKRNRFYTANFSVNRTEWGEDPLDGPCNVSSFRVLNDSIFEVKVGSVLFQPLYDTTRYIVGGPYYYYLTIKNNKLEQSRTNRNFAFTKFVKMDDSYLNGCYVLQTNQGKTPTSKITNSITPEMLQVMKNEIYADYGFEFKDKRWEGVFEMSEMYRYNSDGNREYSKNVQDSLTAIDKYNINFIDQKLKAKKAITLAAK